MDKKAIVPGGMILNAGEGLAISPVLLSTYRLLQYAPNPYCLLIADSMDLLLNKAATTIFQSSEINQSILSAEELFTSPVWSLFLNAANEATIDRPTIKEQVRIPLVKDGVRNFYSYFKISFTAVIDDNGSNVGCLLCFDNNTPQVLAEKRLQTVEQLSSSVNGNITNAQVCANAIEALKQHQDELVFAQLYLYNPITQSFTYATGFHDDFDSSVSTFLQQLANTTGANASKKNTQEIAFPLSNGQGLDNFRDLIALSISAETKKPAAVLIAQLTGVSFDESAESFLRLICSILEAAFISTVRFSDTNWQTGLVLNKAPFAIAFLEGPEFIIRQANQKCLELWDRTAEQVLDTKALDAFPELRDQDFVSIFTAVYKNSERYISKERSIKLFRNGRLEDAWINFVYEPVSNEAGDVTGIMAVGVEVTDYVLTKIAVEQSEQQFRDLLMQSPSAICILKGPGYVVELANKYYLQIVHRNAEELVGLSIFDSIPELANQGIKELLDNVVQTGETFHGYDYPVDFLEHGKTRRSYFNFTYQALSYNTISNDQTGVIVVANDITDQVMARHALETSVNEFSNLVMQSPIAMAIFRGKDFLIEMANKTLTDDIWKLPLEEVKGKKLLDVFPELAGQKYPELLQRVFTTGIAHKENESHAIVRQGDGLKDFYFNYEYAPLTDVTGAVDGIMVTVTDVTDQVLAKKKLLEAEQRSRLAIEAADMGTFDWNLETNEFIGSPRLAAIFGQDPAMPVRHNILIDSFHPEDKKARDEAVANSHTKGQLSYEARIIMPDKSLHWVKVFGKTIFDDAQKPLRMYGTVTDITDEKQTMLALEKSESRLSMAINATQLATYDVDLETQQIICNDTYYQIFKLEPGTRTVRQDTIKLFYPDDLPIRAAALQQAETTGKFEYEVRIILSNNRIHWIRAIGILQFDADNTPKRIIGVLMDITDQRNYITELLASEQRFKIIADSAPVMLWMADTDSKMFFLNKGWLNFRGTTMAEEKGDGWQAGVHPEDIQHYLEVFQNAYENQEPFYTEFRLKRADGQYRWISDNGVPRYAADGSFAGFVGGCMDIDEQKRLHENLSKSAARLRIAALSGELGTWDYDPVTNQLHWDDAFEIMLGVQGQEASMHLLRTIVHPHDLKLASLKVERVFDPAIAESFDLEFRIHFDSKETLRWLHAKGKAFFQDGKMYRFAGTVIDITPRKLALEALQESELLFKTISNTSPVGLWLTNDKGVNTFVNQTWADWIGVSAEEQLKIGWLSNVHEDDKHTIIKNFQSAFRRREKFTGEFRFFNTKGEMLWGLTEGYPFYNTDRSFAGYAGSVTNITELRNAMTALQKSEESFRVLANAMPQFVWTTDAEGNFTYFNKAVFDYTGIKPGNIEKSTWIEIVHPAEREENIRRWRHSMQTGEHYFIEHRFRKHDGEYRWQLCRAVPQQDASGKIHMWIGSSTDINDQKLAAEELENKVRQRTAELEQLNGEIIKQKEFVEIIIDSSLVLVTVFDPQTRIISVNKKCEEVFNVSKESVLGKRFNEVFPGIEASITYSNLQEAFTGKQVHNKKFRSVINNNYYESYFVPIIDQHNVVTAVLMTAHDITDNVQSTEKVQQAYSILEDQNRALERSNQELESFSYVASHDLQEPLRKIQTFIDLLHRNLGNAEVSEKYFEKITTSAQRMTALISDVLNYSRLGRQDEHIGPVDMNQLLDDIQNDLELLIAEKQATIIYNNLPVLRGSAIQLNQLFTNLVNNALKFSDKQPEIQISAATLSPSEVRKIKGLNRNLSYTKITFSDNGIGFEQQYAEKIFAIFQRLNHRLYTGTGIGLALCKKIVENHFGTITAEGKPGKGATFIIHLPLA